MDETSKKVDEMAKKQAEIEGKIDEVFNSLERLRGELEEQPDKLGWDDITQEIIGAISFAFPFLFTGELWEIAKEISLERSLAIFIITVVIAYLFITKSKIGNLKKETLFYIPRRLLTVLVIAYLISAGMIYLYGIYIVAHFTTTQFINATILISKFAVIGAIAVDMVK
ncbi:MAG: hypothetical protein XD40_0929 [Archaeoglobus fulgidus]|uniref:DUF2391 family protein n=1 Tax=Archaeoglobus fulgidus TaxID=2234 RepID=A0A101DE69_ARCFL|nr:DUF2391 family protein [Archaeoglobus fulgidus]KUJ93895.1 MAG: hypothetical protein XD40_0929 [Archaeoglobus fulgidus]KUK07258.1 MAG: hypothetical protein XD48_0521 [Archaeoglobus fulgidus]